MPYSFREIEQKLRKLWYKVERQRGSHAIFSDWKVSFPVPKHDWRQISPWVESSIIRCLGISKDDFMKL